MSVPTSATFNLAFNDILDASIARIGGDQTTGYMGRSGRRAAQLLLQTWQNKGLNFWTVDLQFITLVQGQQTYTLPADTFDVLEMVTRTFNNAIPTDLIVERIGRTQYEQLPNKLDQGTPYLAFIDRQLAAPVLYTYPTSADSVTQLQYYRIRRLKDVTMQSDNLDIPAWFLPAMISGLAYYLSLERPEIDPTRRAELKGLYMEEFDEAQEANRERAPTSFFADYSAYFR